MPWGLWLEKGRAGFFNFLISITPDCDCVPWSDAAIVQDIGILASLDPVAIDQASFDLVNRQMGLAGTLLQKSMEPGSGQVPRAVGGHHGRNSDRTR